MSNRLLSSMFFHNHATTTSGFLAGPASARSGSSGAARGGGASSAAGRAGSNSFSSREELTKNEVTNILDKQKQILKSLLPDAPDDEAREKVFKRLEASAVKLIRTYILASEREGVIAEAVKDIEAKILDAATKDTEIDALIKEMGEKSETAENAFLDSLTDAKVEKNKIFADHKAEMTALYEDMVEDAEQPPASDSQAANADFIPTVDPITKGKLVDPVKNAHCGHVYGKKSILEMIEGKKAKCPYAGCANRNFIKAVDLVTDKELSKKIAERLAKGGTEKTPTRKSVRRGSGTVHDLDASV